MTPKANRAAPPSMQSGTSLGSLATLLRCECLARASETGTRSKNTKINVINILIITTTQRKANTTQDMKNHPRGMSGNTIKYMELAGQLKALGQAVA